MRKYSVMILLAAVVGVTTSCQKREQKVRNMVTVKTMTASETASISGPSYAGTIEEFHGTAISFAGAGTIESLHMSDGQHVKAGQLLATIDATASGNAATMAHAATVQAMEGLKQAEDAYKRMKQLHDNGSLSEMKWVEVETKVAQARQMVGQAEAAEKIAQKGLADARLTAPFSGYITQRSGEIGQNVLPGQPIARLVKIDQVKVKISVPETEVSKMQTGQQIRFRVASLENRTFTGTICEKSISADPVSRSYTVKALVKNTDHILLPGMICDAFISHGEKNSVRSLPAHIIQIDHDNKTFVWTLVNGEARKTFVTLGENIGENVVILNGIKANDLIIVEGQQKVSNGQKVKTNK